MSEEFSEVVVPKFSVNENAAKLIEWYVADGGPVSTGDTVCGLETSKAAFDIDVNATGHIVHLAEVGAEVRVGKAIALIGPDLQALKAEKARRVARAGAAESASGESKEPLRATRKAISLARELGIDLDGVGVGGIVREEDVRRIAAKSSQHADPVTRGWVPPPNSNEAGFLTPEFLARIEKDPTFAQLGSDLKVYLYRSFGAQIGENVKIGSGSVILSRVIRLCHDAEICSNSYIKTDRFVLGRMSVIGNGARIMTREVVIGDVLFSGENVLIGGGGGFGPRSSLRVGDNCLISSNCVLNTGEPITVGDEVGLSPNVQLYTHNHWQNVLRGYTARHAPIVIASGAYITGSCLVAPGVHIGEGATVLANSVVAANVEPYTVVSGVPAKMVSRINTDLTKAEKERIVRRLMVEMNEILRFRGFDSKRVTYTPRYECMTNPEVDVILTFEAVNMPESLERPVVFDLTTFRVYGAQTRLSDEVRNFLRRRGIRFAPRLWRYTHDQGFYVQ